MKEKKLDSDMGVIYTITNKCTLNRLNDECKYTLSQCPEGWLSHQRDPVVALASLESFDMYWFSSRRLTCVFRRRI